MATILDHRGDPIAPRASRRSLSERARRTLRARYDAAQESEQYSKHWANADGLSADAANQYGVRLRLRKRARYEVTNNSYARGMTLTLANDTIGTGPRLQMLSGNAGANRQIEAAFGRWAGAIRLTEKLQTARVAKCQDGEAFFLITNNPAIGRVQLDIRPIEADQVMTPDLSWLDEFAIDGIKFDHHWNPREYDLLKYHPGTNRRLLSIGQNSYDKIPAANMIHLFRADRPGQHRGVPEIVAALPLFAQLRRFTLATISAAETAANFAAVIQSQSIAEEEPAEVDALDTIELERNMATTLPKGWTLGQVKAEHPATTYEMFRNAILNEIARCLNMPYNIAAGNSSGYNYSSGRLDHQTYYKSLRVEQDYWERACLDPLFQAWFDEAALAGEVPQIDTLAHQWFWDGHEHVDPAKEAAAQGTRLANHTTTLADEYARRGQDWETQLRQRAAEMQLMQELGLSPAAPQDAAAALAACFAGDEEDF
jgi:lambda family phage portal protein